MSKGISLIPFAFVALVIALGIISWSLYNVYYGSKYQLSVFEYSKLDTMRNEMEKTKKFLKQSCIYSSHQSLFEHGAGGGIIPPEGSSTNAWICNTPQPPTLSKTKRCLEKFTKFYVNIYFENQTIELPVSLAKALFENSEYNVTKSGVFRGKYDEGNFNVLLEDGKVSLSTKNIQITDSVDQNERIDKNRFWYLWRIFYKWAQANVYGKEMCKCTSSCGGCDCAEKAAQKALKDLQRRFDKYVTCQKSCGCCYGCQAQNWCSVGKASCGVSCQPSQCLPWRQNKCVEKCNKDCANPEDIYKRGFNVSGLYISNQTGRINRSELYEFNFSTSKKQEGFGNGDSGDEEEDCCPVYLENKLAAVYTYTCEDKKYYVPGEEGPKPMVFQVNAFASYLDKDGCGKRIVCPCPC